MSKLDNFNTSGHVTLEQMSTEELEEILRQSVQSESETDENTILLVLKVLEQREATVQREKTNAAWETFAHEHIVSEELKIDRTKKPKKRKSIAKIAGIAAAVALVIFTAGIFITPVEGTNLWTVLANWTKETLGIGTEGEEWSEDSVPEQLAELSERLKEYKLDLPYLLPTYIPEGYHTTATMVDNREDVTVFFCQMESGESTIGFQYRCKSNGASASELQKNIDEPEIYRTACNIDVFIVDNNGLYNAIWIDGDIECEILGVPSKDELIQILDSIRGE